MATSGFNWMAPVNLATDGGGSGGAGMGANPGGSSNQFFPVLPPTSAGGFNWRAPVNSGAGSGGGGRQPLAGAGPLPGAGLSVPPANAPLGGSPGGPQVPGGAPTTTTWGGLANWGHGSQGQGPLDPNLTNAFDTWLQGQIGQGLTPFNLPTAMPWGGTTQPGQLNAGLDPIMQSLLQGFQGQGFQGMPGMGTLQNVAQNGISAVGPWQSMVDAMQRQIGQGSANLKEQFNVGSGVVGTPYGTAATDYQLQSNKDLEGLLANMQFQGIGEQLGAANSLAGMGMNFGEGLQQMGQQDIQNMMQEFMRTQPQYNPLIPNIQGMGTTFQPVIGKSGQGGGILGGLLGAAGSILPLLGI